VEKRVGNLLETLEHMEIRTRTFARRTLTKTGLETETTQRSVLGRDSVRLKAKKVGIFLLDYWIAARVY
jgi:hypothetical protein